MNIAIIETIKFVMLMSVYYMLVANRGGGTAGHT